MSAPVERTVITRTDTISFRNVPFLVESESSKHGHKIAIHDYVNSNKRFVEQLGLVPSEFSIIGYVNTTEQQGNARDRRDALIDALNQTGSGILSHPYFGVVSVKVGRYDVSSVDKESGKIRFVIPFYREDGEQLPEKAADTLSTLQSSADGVRSELEQSGIASLVTFAEQTAATLRTFTDKIEEVAEDMQLIINSATGPDSLIFEAVSIVSDLNTAAAKFARAPSELLFKVNSFFGAVSGLTVTTEVLLRNFSGENDIKIPQDTADRRYRSQVVTLINSFYNIQKTVASFEQAAAANYDNADQLNEAISSIENQFALVSGDELLLVATTNSQIIQENVYNPTLDTNLGIGLYDQFIESRDIALRVLNDIDVASSQVVTTESNLTSAVILTYLNYGNLDNLDIISRLNTDQSLASLNNSVKIITSG